MESESQAPEQRAIHGLGREAIVSLLQGTVSLAVGRSIHARIASMGLQADAVLASLLVRMYRNCGAMEEARALFEKAHHHGVASWNAMIAAYTKHGHSKEALLLFQEMLCHGVRPDEITFASVLRACASLKASSKGRIVHGYAVELGLESDVVVGTALVTMYAKCGALEDARSAFERIRHRNVVSWNALITAYSQQGHGHASLRLFQQMQLENVTPNEVTFVSVLNACSGRKDLGQGEAIHASIADRVLESNVILQTALVTMYGRCGALQSALAVFDVMRRKDIVSWTAMISACAQHGHGKRSLQLFRQMQQEGLKPDRVTLVSALTACAGIADLTEGR